jgi:glycosyltransferase involved in cell wall biosynthesis
MPADVPPKKVLVLLIGEVRDDPRVSRTCRSLRARGVDVTIACTDPSRRPSEEEWEGMRIVRFPHRRDSTVRRLALALQKRIAPKYGGAIERMHEETQQSRFKAAVRGLFLSLNFRTYLRETLRINRGMIRKFSGETFDLVHANDMDTLPAGSALKRSGAARALLYDSHEYWPGIGVHGSAANDAIRRIEEEGIGSADYTVTVNPFIAGLIRKEHGLAAEPSVVMNCPLRDETPLPDIPASPLRVLYQGKIQAFRGIGELILAFREIEGAELTVSGDGPLLERFRLLASTEGLEGRVRFTGRYEPDDTLAIVREHHIGVLPFSPSTLSITYSSPNKLFDYMMGGLAVAATDLPFLRSVIEGERCGILMPGNSPGEIAAVIRGLGEEPERLAEYRRNAREAALARYCWEERFSSNYPWSGADAT